VHPTSYPISKEIALRELDGKVALVTGSGRGIGKAVAERLHALGAQVVINDIDEDEARAVAGALDGAVHVGDLTRPGVPDQLVDAALEAFGRLDILVNNAGYVWDAPIHKVTDEQFQAMLDIHTVVPFRVCRAAAAHLRAAAKAEAAAGEEVFRKIVNVVSLAGVFGNAGQVAYGAAKAGTIGFTRSLAKEWGPLKVNVNAVAFGLIETRMTAELPDPARAMLASSIPLQRGATPEEAAAAVGLLCGPASNYVHGQVLPVSGGLALGMS
jgi:3-oxoacyl-[acyl-carrier protein] reductase